ncbi:hypothetical protein IHE45_01G015100 [Dioscorea alata]|uniref:Uncharacterized protein n=1 Tax=Dioscorea alata TaxID=55571 RepID=A0ACB7WSE2_DIOAL|nr:hypothetical protein IHE45_01G015100 [Dioscorea alata]
MLEIQYWQPLISMIMTICFSILMTTQMGW